jgi:hypothetical protein
MQQMLLMALVVVAVGVSAWAACHRRRPAWSEEAGRRLAGVQTVLPLEASAAVGLVKIER